MRRFFSLFFALGSLAILTITLSGCGKKASPKPVGPPEKVIYPRAYPPQD